jgi:TRAP-type C4-dicarboxylate transport system permease large subunit
VPRDAAAASGRHDLGRRLDLSGVSALACAHDEGLWLDPVWFGVLLTMAIAMGGFTPPMAVNLLVACRMAGISMESTIPWVGWLVLAFSVATLSVMLFPELALWLPRSLKF